MADDPKLHTADLALIHAAKTGEGVVELTSEMLEEIYETRLAVTSWVFEAIVKHAQEGGTFRYLIYDRLGFNADAYVPLYLAGGMTISNEFDMTGKDNA